MCDVEETRSNASSTDDYVRELLDPDDRRRNVWHVVEGPKVQPENQDSKDSTSQAVESETSDNLDSSQKTNFDVSKVKKETNDLESESDYLTHNLDRPTNNNETQGDEDGVDVKPSEDTLKESRVDELKKEHSKHRRDRSRERSSSSRHHSRHHNDRDRERHRERDRDKDKDRDLDYSKDRDHERRRDRNRDRDHSPIRRRDSRDRRDRDRDRHRSSRKREHSDDDSHDRHRRDRSRRSRSRGRHHGRSRSNSQSPLTKRNSRTILIMQLNPRVDSQDLEDFFSSIGKVREVRLIMDGKTRRHKGVAYIEFEDAASAAKASEMNGRDFCGAPMVIQSAQLDKSGRSGDWYSSTSSSLNYSSSHPSSRSQLPPNSYRVYAGGLHVGLTEDMLRSVFEPFGQILRLELMRDRATNVSRGYAFITYANIEDGQDAVEKLDGLELGGKPIKVSKSTDKSERHTSGSNNLNAGSSRSSGGHHDHDSDYHSRSGRQRDVTASLYELAGQ